jgi:hypothetical protein
VTWIALRPPKLALCNHYIALDILCDVRLLNTIDNRWGPYKPLRQSTKLNVDLLIKSVNKLIANGPNLRLTVSSSVLSPVNGSRVQDLPPEKSARLQST